MKNIGTKKKYFAAANGYSGFRSYFNSVFNPEDYERIYIIKGGPGTGKSSLMKRLLTELSSICADCEAIYCSSDTASLDGIILKSNERKIAVIDGTAPHMTDPKYPGAVECIVNLGEHFNISLLKNNSDFIKKATSAKNSHYKSAYEHLSIAGRICAVADREIKARYTRSDKDRIEALIADIGSGSGRIDTRLITAFGKGGFEVLGTPAEAFKRVHYVVGIYGSEFLFTAHLKKALDDRGVDYVHLPSAADGDKSFGFIFPASSAAIVINNSGKPSESEVIDTSAFLTDMGSRSCERLEFLWKEREVFLWNSTDEFKKASDEHFALERLYSSAMDFTKADEIFNSICTEAREILI